MSEIESPFELKGPFPGAKTQKARKKAVDDPN